MLSRIERVDEICFVCDKSNNLILDCVFYCLLSFYLYQIIQKSNSTEKGYSQDLAILIDLIFSNELYETAAKACNIVSEFAI